MACNTLKNATEHFKKINLLGVNRTVAPEDYNAVEQEIKDLELLFKEKYGIVDSFFDLKMVQTPFPSGSGKFTNFRLDFNPKAFAKLDIAVVNYNAAYMAEHFKQGDQFTMFMPPTVKPGVEEIFEENPELANSVYEALGFKNKLKTFLGKELEYKDAYISANRLKDFKQYQVLDEKGNDIGSVVIEYRGDKNVILHPKLNISGKGYGKDLYKLISSKFNVEIQEWNEGGISKSDSAKAMWDSLEKEGSVKRIVDEEQGDNFRVLKYNTQITPQQKQLAQQLYSIYIDTIFPNSKVKDIVYHGSKSADG